MVIRYQEVVGTGGADTLGATAGDVVYGLQGDDILKAPAVFDALLDGGTGGDSYAVSGYTRALVLDTGGSLGDSLTLSSIAYDSTTTRFAIIDDSHLWIGDTSTGAQVYLLNWQTADSAIETITFSDGTSFAADALMHALPGADDFLGTYSWTTWASAGETGYLFTKADIDDLIDHTNTRSTALEASVGARPLVGVRDLVVTEGDDHTTVAHVLVELSAPAGQTIVVPWSTGGGSAIAGFDYTAAHGNLVFAAGQSSATIDISILGNTIPQADRDFLVQLGTPAGAEIADGTATVTIADDDVPTITVSNAEVREGDSGYTRVDLAVHLSAASTETVSFSFKTADGSATLLDGDYVQATGGVTFAPMQMLQTSPTVTFSAGETDKVISLLVAGDTAVEPNETFAVNLYGAQNATLAAAQATVTILNDDGPTLSIDDARVNEGDAGTHAMTFTVRLSAASTSAITVDWATGDGSGVAGTDYVAANGTLTFAAGSTTATIDVLVIGNVEHDGDRVFVVDLANAGGATILRDTATGLIVDDDPAVAGLAVTGTAAADTLSGAAGPDTILGLDGADSLYGADGADSIAGGAGSDTVEGGAGNDLLDERSDTGGANLLSGGAGDDTMWGGAGADYLVGGDGADQIHGGDGADTIGEGVDATGANVLYGDGGADLVVGGGGADTLFGGDGADTVYGGAGADRLDESADMASANVLLGEAGNDTILAGSAPAGDWVVGGDGNDSIAGNGGADRLFGDATDGSGTGNDVIDGGAGADTIVAGGGDDTLHGGIGADEVHGGAGLDFLDESADTGAVTNLLFGEAGDDTIFGGQGQDAGTGIGDYIEGGAGADSIAAGAGNDLVYGDDAAGTTSGADTIDGGRGDDTIFGGDGNDAITGGLGQDTIYGGAGDDTLDSSGDTSANLMSGDAGNDLLHGGFGADTLLGGAGADTIVGAGGADVLSGGAGADVFAIDATHATAASIVDFSVGSDRFGFLLSGFPGIDVAAVGDFGTDPGAPAGAGQFAAGTAAALAAMDKSGLEVVVITDGTYASSDAALAAAEVGQASAADGFADDGLLVVYRAGADDFHLSYDANGTGVGGESFLASLGGVDDHSAGSLVASDFLFWH